MSDVRAQYEAFPYPARDPADEASRLITGSPSFPTEMDHHLWGGQRDWNKPLNALFAGGGTGDGLIQLAQRLSDANKPYNITYIDVSKTSKQIAQARANIRGLQSITFLNGSLLDAPKLGTFDYIDCCGVLHHLPDPKAGLTALRNALAPGGGLGFMVYAPYGRAGVYPLQAAFNRLYGHLPPKTRLKAAQKAFSNIPAGHPFNRNPHLGDHTQSAAGFYDLLVHSQDQAFSIGAWIDTLDQTGWTLAGLAQPGLYDLAELTGVPDGLSPRDQMVTAEELRGTIKTHVGYARAADDAQPMTTSNANQIPHLCNVKASDLSQAIKQGKLPPLRIGSETVSVQIRPEAAPLIAAIDGKRNIAEIAKTASIQLEKAQRLWAGIDKALTPWGVLHYARVLV